jgi:hypothetical protein
VLLARVVRGCVFAFYQFCCRRNLFLSCKVRCALFMNPVRADLKKREPADGSVALPGRRLSIRLLTGWTVYAATGGTIP